VRGKARRLPVRVAVTRTVDHRRVPVYVLRSREVTTVERTSTQVDDVQYAPRYGCMVANRARIAADTIRLALPAIRAAAPRATILLGETSPCPGVLLYISDFLRYGLRADGWAHHPYLGPWEAGLDHAERVNAAVGMPVYWTEFGVPVRHDDDAEPLDVARALWRRAFAKAQSLGVREIVSYGWRASPDGTHWDTAAQGVLW
jgi:hypothetical protein